MKNGEFAEGTRTLRAKIDLASGNFNMDSVKFLFFCEHFYRFVTYFYKSNNKI